MEYISAPWRADYVKNAPKMKGCIFCAAEALGNDREAYILFRGRFNFIILNKYPYNPGHLMIAPFQHLDTLEKTEPEALWELMDLLQASLINLKDYYHPQGFNTGMNLGKSAGAGVADHYHMHIIPRWTGDANFMPLIGETKVVLEPLEQTYEKLLPLFGSIQIRAEKSKNNPKRTKK